MNGRLENTTTTGTIVDNDNLPEISIDDVTAFEGDAGVTNFDFTITLDDSSSETITVGYLIQGISAISADDYEVTSGVLTFVSDDTLQVLTVSVLGDIYFEGADSFNVVLNNPVNAVLLDSIGLGIIANDDSMPALTITGTRIIEGTGNNTQAVLVVSQDRASINDVSFSYSTSDGSAMSSLLDYVAVSNASDTIRSGYLSTEIIIDIIGDANFELDETFAVTLSNVQNGTIAVATDSVTIVNDDDVVSISIGNVQITEDNNAVFTVNLSAMSDDTVTVEYRTFDQTALEGEDYVSVSDTLTFQPRVTTGTITITIIDDNKYENDEIFGLELFNSVNGRLENTTTTGTIVDNDNLPEISIDDVTAFEGDAGVTNFDFAITLDDSSSERITVGYLIQGISAISADDYEVTSGVLTFVSDDTLQVLTVSVLGDIYFEGADSFNVVLNNPVNAVLLDSIGLGIIANDDSMPALTITGTRIIEGTGNNTQAVLVVSQDRASINDVSFSYSTSDGSAMSSLLDYVAVSNASDTIRSGYLSTEIIIDIIGDANFELDETFAVTLFNAQNGTIAVATDSVTIVNDDDVVSISIGNVQITEDNNAVFTIIQDHIKRICTLKINISQY